MNSVGGLLGIPNNMVSMTSFEVLPMDALNETVSNTSGFTFIHDMVIPHAEPIPNDVDSADSCSSFDSILNLRLEALVEEKNILKDKIHQNSKVIENLLATVSSLKKLIGDSNDKYQANLKTIAEEKQKLESEKNKLSEMVKQFEEAMKEMEEEQTLQDKKLEDVEQKFVKATEEKDELKAVIEKKEKKQEEMQAEIDRLTTELATITLEFKFLENEKNDIMASYFSLQEKQAAMERSVAETKILDEDMKDYDVISHYEQNEKNVEIENLMQLLQVKDTEIKDLKKDIDQLVKENAEMVIQKDKELAEINQKLDSTVRLVEESKKDYISISELEVKMKKTDELLEHEKTVNQTTKEELAKTKEELMQLEEERSNQSLMLDKLFQRIEDLRSTKAYLEQQNLLTLDGLAAKICYLEQELEQSRSNVASLTKQLSNQNGESECVRVLQAQVDMYKSDYECEKMASDSAQQKVEKLTHIVEGLQQQLEAKASKHHESRKHKSRSSGNSHKNSNGTTSPQTLNQVEAPSNMQCPCCPATFFVFKDLERHVVECLEKNGN